MKACVPCPHTALSTEANVVFQEEAGEFSDYKCRPGGANPCCQGTPICPRKSSQSQPTLPPGVPPHKPRAPRPGVLLGVWGGGGQ